jgi:hypothetical protein
MIREFMFNPDYVADNHFLNDVFSRGLLVDWKSGATEKKKPGFFQRLKKAAPETWYIMTREDFLDIVPLLHEKPQEGQYRVHHLSSYVAFVEREVNKQRVKMSQLDPKFTNRVLSFAFYATNDGMLLQRIVRLSFTISVSILNRLWRQVPELGEGSQIASSLLSSVVDYHYGWLNSVPDDIIADQFLALIQSDAHTLYSILTRSSEYLKQFPQHGLPSLIKDAPTDVISLFLTKIQWQHMELALSMVPNKVTAITKAGSQSIGNLFSAFF